MRLGVVCCKRYISVGFRKEKEGVYYEELLLKKGFLELGTFLLKMVGTVRRVVEKKEHVVPCSEDVIMNSDI